MTTILQILRVEKKYTQREIAKLIRRSPQTACEYENGKLRIADPAIRSLLSGLYSTSEDVLFDENGFAREVEGDVREELKRIQYQGVYIQNGVFLRRRVR